MRRERVIVLGAAGRDFHDFNVRFRDDPSTEVVAFTAAQIPDIAGRHYPASLAGPLYPEGIPIHPEEELEARIAEHDVDAVVFSYSDVSHEHVMHLASRALAAGAGFRLLGPRRTMLRATVPVVAVCAVRTGCGKSPTARFVVETLRRAGARAVVVRHPMPYGDLEKQRLQRFASVAELDGAAAPLTLEEREEYEPHVAAGTVVFAGVDYAAIVEAAAAEADVLVWDGGNNDLPFVAPDLWITLADAKRPGQEVAYHPGEANFRAADCIVISKTDAETETAEAEIRRRAQALNPRASVVAASLEVRVDDPEAIRGRRVLLVEDGPTLTHGGMPHGAAYVAAERFGAATIVDPRPHAVGSIAAVYGEYPHLGSVLPAMGYSPAQREELEATIASVDCDVVLVASPVDLSKVLTIARPTVRVAYDLREAQPGALEALLASVWSAGSEVE